MIQEEGGEGGSEVVSSRGEVWYWRLREEEQEEDLSDALSHTRRSLSLLRWVWLLGESGHPLRHISLA